MEEYALRLHPFSQECYRSICCVMLGVSFLGLHVPVLVSRTKHRGSTLLVPLTHSTKTG